jgi:hypothetical protein
VPLRRRLADENLPELHRLQDEAIAAAPASDVPPYEGAGIVIVAGGARLFTNAYVVATLLREHLGTTLPIQVWHLGPSEMSIEMARILHALDVETVDAFEVRKRRPARRLGGWEAKSFAVLYSPFRHVFLLDADNMPLVDPAVFLDAPQYRETGAIFWSDNHSHLEDSPVWRLFRVPYRPELEVESGQLLIDKARCWVPLNLARHLNDRSDVYYRYIYGDKETFHFAWRHLGVDYAMPPGRPCIVYYQNPTRQGPKRMTAALEHRDFDGNAIFHHRTGAEWLLHGDNPRTTRHDLEERCLAAPDRLRGLWDGRVTPLPEPVKREGMAGRWWMSRPGFDEREIALLPDGAIGEGASPDVRAWRLDGNALVLDGNDGETCRLTRGEDGIWRGVMPWYRHVTVELVPIS